MYDLFPRRGHLLVSNEIMQKHTEKLMSFCQNILIVRAEFMHIEDGMKYTGHSEFFDVCNEGEMPSTYILNVDGDDFKVVKQI